MHIYVNICLRIYACLIVYKSYSFTYICIHIYNCLWTYIGLAYKCMNIHIFTNIFRVIVCVNHTNFIHMFLICMYIYVHRMYKPKKHVLHKCWQTQYTCTAFTLTHIIAIRNMRKQVHNSRGCVYNQSICAHIARTPAHRYTRTHIDRHSESHSGRYFEHLKPSCCYGVLWSAGKIIWNLRMHGP